MPKALLREDVETVWPKVSAAMLDDPVLFFRMSLSGGAVSFGTSRESDGGGHVVTSNVPDEKLLDWAREEGSEAAGMVAKLAKAFLPGNPPQWTPLVRAIIDEFGDDDEVLSEISSNLFSFGSVGSRAPYYRTRIALLDQLRDHEHARVREWARVEIERYEQYARREDVEDQERGLGVW